MQIVPQLAPVLSTAFQMEESEPQLAEVVPGKQFVIFEVARVDEAAAPPLAGDAGDVVGDVAQSRRDGGVFGIVDGSHGHHLPGASLTQPDGCAPPDRGRGGP